MDDEDYWYNDETVDDFDDDDKNEADDSLDKISDADVIMAATSDRDIDRAVDAPIGSNYGGGIDLNELTDEQRSLYDAEYYGVIDPDEADDF